jgi:TPR repeat protein
VNTKTALRLWIGVCAFCVALAAKGDPKADYQKGVDRYNNGDVVEAMPLLRRAADAGDADAQAFYAFVLSASQFEEEAVAYYRKSAAQNNLEGIAGLAGALATGEGVTQDLPGALKLYRQAAALGHGTSINVIAAAYLGGGLGFTAEQRASPEALEAIRKAAENGHIQSALMMVKVYQEGLFGQSPDANESKRWLEIANKIVGVKPDAKKKRRR